MYSRILAQFILPKDIDRILWLDADIVVCKDISVLYDMPFENNYIISCANLMTETVEERKKSLGLSEEDIYFNSGVLLLNLKKLREETVKEEIYNTIAAVKNKLLYPDQDILNVLYKKCTKIVDYKKYNYQLNCEKTIPEELVNDIVILHYTGKAKPWVYRNVVESSLPYWNVMRKMGNYIPFIIAKVVYLLKKVSNKSS